MQCVSTIVTICSLGHNPFDCDTVPNDIMAACFTAAFGEQEVVEIESEDEPQAPPTAGLESTEDAGRLNEGAGSEKPPENNLDRSEAAEASKPKPIPEAAPASPKQSQEAQPATLAAALKPDPPSESKTQSAATKDGRGVESDGESFDVGDFKAGGCTSWYSIGVG